jgi:ammonia channel protein AmtB
MAARGAAAGVLSVAAAMAFVPPWAALALGLAAGLLVPLLTFLVHHVLRIEDPTGAVAVGLVGGVLGVLAVGLFADGLAGQGWNGIGVESYLGVTDQGVTGFAPAAGLAPDWPGQLNAQLIGLAAISALTAVVIGVLFLVLKVLHLLWRAVPAPEGAERVPSDEVESQDTTPDLAAPPDDIVEESAPGDETETPESTPDTVSSHDDAREASTPDGETETEGSTPDAVPPHDDQVH